MSVLPSFGQDIFLLFFPESAEKGVRKTEPVVMDAVAMDRALMRIAHQIIEKNESTENLCIVGIKRRGEQLGNIIAKNLEKLGATVKTGSLDITLYRDDLSQVGDQPKLNSSSVGFDVGSMTVVLVDDVIYTGRTARAAIDAILSFGRPAKIQLAVLVDRGHRELPIRADYVGKNVPTSKIEVVKVCILPYETTQCVKIIKNS